MKRFCDTFWVFNKIRQFLTPFFFFQKRKRFLFDNSSYFRVNLGCRRKYCYGYVNIDESRYGKRIFVSSFKRLPFRRHQAKRVLFNYTALHVRHEQRLNAILTELGRIMVEGGILIVDNCDKAGNMNGFFRDRGFHPFGEQHNTLFGVKNFIFSAPRRSLGCPTAYYQEYEKNRLRVSLGFAEGDRPGPLEEHDLPESTFEKIELVNILEYLPAQKIERLLLLLKRALADEGVLCISAYNEKIAEGGRTLTFFDKTNLAHIVTESGLFIVHLEQRAGGLFLKAAKKVLIPQRLKGTRERYQGKKICLLGQYMLYRYTQLGFTWGGIPRAAQGLGMQYRLIETMRSQSPRDIQNEIISYKPDYLLVVLRENLSFLYDIRKELKREGIKTIFWFCDPEHPSHTDFSELIHTMFLTNRGQLSEYRKAYSLKRVYYMPQGIDDAFMFYNKAVPETADVAFTGTTSDRRLHARRKEFLELLEKQYVVIKTKAIRNNVNEFYSGSKTVFGISDFNQELYTSNRFFNALGCGSVYVCGKFPGIELLAEHKKHLLWFETKKELLDIMRFYTRNIQARRYIRHHAQTLAHAKHTWTDRLSNMLDIVEGKTESFYGYL